MTSVAAAAHPVTAIVTRITAPSVSFVGNVVTSLHPVTAPAGHLLTSTGLVPARGDAGRPPVAGDHDPHHGAARGAVASVPGTHRIAGIAGGIVGTHASGAAASGHSAGPAGQRAPFRPVGVTLPATGGSASSNTMDSGAGGNATAGHAERVGAAPWPRVIGLAHSSDDIAAQLDAAKPQVSPD